MRKQHPGHVKFRRQWPTIDHWLQDHPGIPVGKLVGDAPEQVIYYSRPKTPTPQDPKPGGEVLGCCFLENDVPDTATIIPTFREYQIAAGENPDRVYKPVGILEKPKPKKRQPKPLYASRGSRLNAVAHPGWAKFWRKNKNLAGWLAKHPGEVAGRDVTGEFHYSTDWIHATHGYSYERNPDHKSAQEREFSRAREYGKATPTPQEIEIWEGYCEAFKDSSLFPTPLSVWVIKYRERLQKRQANAS